MGMLRDRFGIESSDIAIGVGVVGLAIGVGAMQWAEWKRSDISHQEGLFNVSAIQDTAPVVSQNQRIVEAEALLENAKGYSEADWAAMEEVGGMPYETISAYLTENGVKFVDTSGENVNAPLVFTLSDALTSATMGTSDHPTVDAETATASMIVAVDTPTGIAVGRIPAYELPSNDMS